MDVNLVVDGKTLNVKNITIETVSAVIPTPPVTEPPVVTPPVVIPPVVVPPPIVPPVVLPVPPVTPIPAGVYEVGPTSQYKEIHEVPWAQVGENSTIRVNYRDTPYASTVLISQNGVTLEGVPNAAGKNPTITAANAVLSSPELYAQQILHGYGLIVLARRAGTSHISNFQNIQIKNINITGAWRHNLFLKAGVLTPWNHFSSGFYLHKGVDVNIVNVRVEDCGNGLFTIGADDPRNAVRNLTVTDSYFGGNGTYDPSGVLKPFLQHNWYTETDGTLQCLRNTFGSLRGKSEGAHLKDRSAGLHIKDCVFQPDSVRYLDLVEPQESYPYVVTSPIYKQDVVVENNIFNVSFTTRKMSGLIHYGGDTGFPERNRKCLLKFINNKIDIKVDQATGYYFNIIKAETNDQPVHFEGNNITVNPLTAGGKTPFVNWFAQYGTFVEQKNNTTNVVIKDRWAALPTI